MRVKTRPPLTSPAEWDRFNVQHVDDLSAVTGTPGIAEVPAGKTLGLLDTTYRQETPSGFFLVQAEQTAAPLGAFPSAERALQDLGAPPVSGDGITMLQKFSTATGTHLRARQTIGGIPIVGADLNVHADGESAYALTGRPVAELEKRRPEGRPPQPTEEVVSAVAAVFDLPVQHNINVEVVVFPFSDSAVWAFRASFVVGDPVANVRAFFNADLELMLSYNVASSALPGRASVFPVNPLRTPGLVDVDLSDLGDAPPGQLSGIVVTISPGQPPPLSRPKRDFRLGAHQQGFDEAQGYYHVWQALQYYGALMDLAGLSSPPFRPVRAVVNDPKSRDNAYFVPDTGDLLFGDFDGIRPSARSADIVYHELGHAFTDTICALGRGLPNSEARGMSEGYSDYFAASALDNPRMGDYVADLPEGARNCGKSDLRFPERFDGEEHATGEVWASFLWAIKQQIGQQDADADALAAGSLSFLSHSSTFEEGRAALIMADRRLFPDAVDHGAHEMLIEHEFDARRP